MDNLAPTPPSPKRRQSYTPEFKAKVLQACDEPGNSIASVAREYSLNANLVHKWRRQQGNDRPNSEFLRLPNPKPVARAGGDTVKFELPGGVVVQWPLDRITDSIPWIKALMS